MTNSQAGDLNRPLLSYTACSQEFTGAVMTHLYFKCRFSLIEEITIR